MQALPFLYLSIIDILAASPYKSRSGLYRAIRTGKFPAPDHIEGKARWRSDLVSQRLIEIAAQADAEREQNAKKAREHGQMMLRARRDHQGYAA
jgi:predicted DNA-binding transcriptional regulator AlpA